MEAGKPTKSRLRWGVALVVFVVLAAVPLYLWATLEYTYSVGDRVGFVQKVSETGAVCNTFKGALLMTTVPGEIGKTFEFNLRDAVVAKRIDELAGHRVIVHYEQHKGVPSTCLGDSEYFATAVRRID